MNKLKVILQYSYLFFISRLRKSQPVVVNTWIQFSRNGSDQRFCGLGDLLRGVCFLHQICQRFGYEYHVDFRGHQLAAFLETRSHPFESVIDQRNGNIEFKVFTENLSAVRHIEQSFTSQAVVAFMTNGSKRTFRDPTYLKPSSKAFTRECFRIKPAIREEIRKRLPSVAYEILHVRLGDGLLVDDRTRLLEDDFGILYAKLEIFIRSNTLFMTDSPAFKRYVTARNPGILFIHGMPVHIGLASSEETLLDTLTEFVALQKASKIYTYSIYNWDSGFAKSASILYDVPIERIPRISPWIDGEVPA
jgi:hypothetical protein